MAARTKPRKAAEEKTKPTRLSPDARELLAGLEALAKEKAPGHVRKTKDPKGWTRLEIAGRGKRRLPGGRDDEREHVVTLSYDGAFLQLAYRVADRLHDSRLLSFPTPADLAVCEVFLRKALARMRFEGKGRERRRNDAPTRRKVPRSA